MKKLMLSAMALLMTRLLLSSEPPVQQASQNPGRIELTCEYMVTCCTMGSLVALNAVMETLMCPFTWTSTGDQDPCPNTTLVMSDCEMQLTQLYQQRVQHQNQNRNTNVME